MHALEGIIAVRSAKSFTTITGFVYFKPDLADLDMADTFDVELAKAIALKDGSEQVLLNKLCTTLCSVGKAGDCSGFRPSEEERKRNPANPYYASTRVHIQSGLEKLAGNELEMLYPKVQAASECQFSPLQELNPDIIPLIKAGDNVTRRV